MARACIIGAGMAGILAAIKLRERGYDPITVLEKNPGLGGTWHDNRYPGLTCDVPAHAYTYSFAPNPEWPAYYATGPEIRAYFETVAERFGVLGFIRFNTEVTGCAWDANGRFWRVKTAQGDVVEAEILVAASGVLHHPNIPDIEGLQNFAGHAFHSARWDDTAPLDAARVGIIGTGSTGVQLLTAMAGRAARVVHFQRSPQWIMPVPFFTYSDEERAAFRRDPALIDAIRFEPQYISNILRFTEAIANRDGPEMAEIEAICRQNLENSVADPALRAKLTPTYRAACKRLIYSWHYYEKVQHPDVYVEIGAIDRIEPAGVRMRDGTLHELDTIVLATGFRADRFIRPAVVVGTGGKALDDAWAVRPCAYYALMVPDFPNLFLLNGPSGPVGNFSLIDIAERQWGFIEQLLTRLEERPGRAVAPTHAGFAAYEESRIAAAKRTIFGSGCTSWYLDATGVPSTWPWSYQAFANAMATPKFEDFEFAG